MGSAFREELLVSTCILSGGVMSQKHSALSRGAHLLDSRYTVRLHFDTPRCLQLALLALPSVLVCWLGCMWPRREGTTELRSLFLLMSIACLACLHRNCRDLPSLRKLAPVVAISLVLAAGGVNFIPCKVGNGLSACRSNLKNIATSLEIYSADNGGLYPSSLAQITPGYLKVLPQCPAVRRDTYSLKYVTLGGRYTVVCGGCHHHSEGIHRPDYPSCSAP